MKSIIVLLAIVAMPTSAATAAKKNSLEYKVRNAPVTWKWEGPLEYYTGNYYGVSLVNTMWQRAPRSKIVLAAAVRYHIPWRLLLGVWGIESGYGRAWNHFGLIGPANGNLTHDANYSARLFQKMYRSWYHTDAVR